MAKTAKTVSDTEHVPCAYIKVQGEEKGPFTFPQIRGWVAREEIPDYVPARRPDDEIFVALLTLPEWKEKNPKVDHHVPPINKAPKVKVTRLNRPLGDVPKKTLVSILIVLVLISIGGVLIKFFVLDRHARMFDTGQQAFLNGDPETAVARFQNLSGDLMFFEIFMKVDVALHLGLSHLELKDTDNAIDQFDTVPEMLYVGRANTNLVSVAHMVMRQEFAPAEKILNDLVRRKPDHLVAQHLLAECYRRQSRAHQYAIKAREKYQDLTLRFPGFLYSMRLADAYMTRKEFEWAIPIYEKARKDGYRSKRLHMQLGTAYLEIDQQAKAIEQFKMAKEINSEVGIILKGEEIE